MNRTPSILSDSHFETPKSRPGRSCASSTDAATPRGPAHDHLPKVSWQGRVEMGDRAAEQFRMSHPEFSHDAVRALRWCYAYDYK
jgi:hypothetical protein